MYGVTTQEAVNEDTRGCKCEFKNPYLSRLAGGKNRKMGGIGANANTVQLQREGIGKAPFWHVLFTL